MSTLGQAQLIIGADDQTGKAFASIEKRIEHLGAMAKNTNAAFLAVNRTSGAVSRASEGLQARASATHRALSGVAGSVGSAGSYIAASALGIGSIYAAKEIAEKIIKEGAARQHERVRMEVSGMSASEMMDAEGAAADLAAKYKPVAQTDIMHMLRNARSIVGSYEEAGKIMDPLLALRVTALGAHPGNQELEADFDKLVKGMEIKGVTQNLPKFREYMDGMAKAINVFGDTLRPTDYYEMFKYGRQATQNLSQDYTLAVAPTLAQGLGGSSAGKAQSAFYNAMIGGKMTVSAARELQNLGLIDKSNIITNKQGDLAKLKPGAISHSALAAMNPYEWVNQILLPAMAKKGIVDPQKIQEVIATVFSNQSAAQMVSIFATQQSRIEKDKALVSGAKGLAAADDFMKKDPEIAWASLKNAFNNAAVEVGLGGENLASAMNSTAEKVNIAAKWLRGIKEGPDSTKPIGADEIRTVSGIVLKRSEWGAMHGITPEKAQKLRADLEKSSNEDSSEDIRHASRLKKMADDVSANAGFTDFMNPWGTWSQVGDLLEGAKKNEDHAKKIDEAYANAKKAFEQNRADDYRTHPFMADQLDKTGLHTTNIDRGEGIHGTHFGLNSNPWNMPDAKKPFATPPATMPWPLHAETIPDLKSLFGPGGAQVSLDPNSKATVEVTIKVDPSSELFKLIQKATASSSGNVNARLGSSMPDAAPLGERRY